jgi:hypothetical protein
MQECQNNLVVTQQEEEEILAFQERDKTFKPKQDDFLHPKVNIREGVMIMMMIMTMMMPRYLPEDTEKNSRTSATEAGS